MRSLCGDDPPPSWVAPFVKDAVAHRVAAHAKKLRHRSYWLFWLLDAYKAATWRGDAAPEAVDAHAHAHAAGFAAALRATTDADVRDAARALFGSARVSAELLPAPQPAARPAGADAPLEAAA